MSVVYAVRALTLCIAISGVALTAGMVGATDAVEQTVAVAQAAEPKAETAEIKRKQRAHVPGRLCPREVGYGKYDQPITMQDI